MAYNINKSNSDPVTIPSSAIDNQFDIPLVGPDAINWGDDIALAFVRLLENFAADNAPAFGSARTTGQLWYDTFNSKLQVYNGATWDNIDGGDAATLNSLADTSFEKVGTQEMWIPASQMFAASSSPAALAASAIATSGIEIQTFDFDPTTRENVGFQVHFPKRWNEDTITYQVYWQGDATTTDVIWGLEAVAVRDGIAMDAINYGTAITITDTGQSDADDLLVSSASAALTIGNTPVAGDLCFFRLYRDAGAGGDTMITDAKLLGVKIYWTSDASNDA